MDNIILNADNGLESVKIWLCNMRDRGTPKYFEILMDGKRIVNKTNALETFDTYKSWLNEFTQSLRVMVYNTKHTHRAQIFELRTEKYIEGQSNKLYATRKRSLSEDEIESRAQAKFEEQKRNAKLSELAAENREIKKLLAGAESYIAKLEKEQREIEKTKDSFDLEGIVKMLLPNLQQQAPGNTSEKTAKTSELSGNEKEQSTVTFKRKEPKAESQPTESPVLIDREKRDLAMLRESHSKLGDALYSKTINIFCFLNDYPEFIDFVNEHLTETADKLGWKNTRL